MSQLSPSFVRKFLRTFDIQVKKSNEIEIIAKLASHIEAVMYNIAGVAMAIALVNQSFTIDVQHLVSVRNYIESSCSKAKHSQKGGMSMPSDYFGYKHPNFSELNANNQSNVSEVRFDQGIARSEMGGGAMTLIPFMSKEKRAAASIKEFLKQHNVKIGKAALSELLAIVDAHVNCLADDLKNVPELSIKKVDKVMKLKRHAVFH